MPALPGSALQLFLLLFFEVFVGVFLGLLTRLVFAAFEIAGMMMSFQVSLGNATIFNPAMATQGSLLSVLISVAGILLIFVTNMHHLMLSAAVDTFTLFQPGNFALPVGDMADFFARTFNQSFLLAFQMAAPLIVIGLLFYLGLGLLGRLMPQVQVFFVAIPLQILLGFFVLSLTISATMLWFAGHFENTLEGFLDLNPF